MNFQLLGSTTLELSHATQWLWYSAATESFVTGDERVAFSLPTVNPRSAVSLPARTRSHACNLPLPHALLNEFTRESWHGFRFLPCDDYEKALDNDGRPVGDVLRSLVFGPSGTYVLHPPSGTILSTEGGSMKLLRRAPGGAGFELLDRTKTRGRAALAFAGHPTEPLVAYGDNAGTFHAHRLNVTKFGKATKVAEKGRNATRVAFVADGAVLAVGGMGYLATFAYVGRTFSPLHEVAIPVRDFLWLNGGQRVLVNQGLHGVAAYRYELGGAGFIRLFAGASDGPVQQIAVSKCARYLAATTNGAPTVRIYAVI